MGILLACMCEQHMHVGLKEPEEGTRFPETELQTVVSCHVEMGSQGS